jgi:hypothetical protein
MAHRIFSDASGREWLVWEVIPATAERQGEARQEMEIRIGDSHAGETPRSFTHLPTAFAGGWLCFESGDEKRRLGPIPPDWVRISDTGLERLLNQAALVSGREGHLDTAKLRAMSRPPGGHHLP